MTDFQEWWEVRKAKSQGMYDAKSLSEDAYLAGQASAEQRVKELERERDNLAHRVEVMDAAGRDLALKAQAGEPDGWIDGGGKLQELNPDGFEDWQPLYTHPKPVKAQAGEPESNLAAFFKLDEQAMELIHPTTERRVPDGWKLVPIEPTHLMERAGHEAEADSLGIAAQIYRAMINAAPKGEV